MISKGGYFSSENTKVYLKFQVDITANHLWGVHRFSSHRQYLNKTILHMIKKGLNYKEIANELNHQNSLSLRQKKFTKSIIYTIIKNMD